MDPSDKENLLAANRANWDSRAPVHAASSAYDIERYAQDQVLVSKVVEFDRDVLGDLSGLDVLHLQCHIGTDSISLARLGARVTALDFSPRSLAVAQDLAVRADANVQFVCADVRTADRVLARTFDLVYASVGILCWIPSFAEWAGAASRCLSPGGRLYLRDDHPIKDTFDYDRDDGQVVCIGDYFAEGVPFRDDSGTTYTGDETRLESPVNYQWMHGVGTIVTTLAQASLRVEQLLELDWLDWKAFPWMVQGLDGRWSLPDGGPRVPLGLAVVARKA